MHLLDLPPEVLARCILRVAHAVRADLEDDTSLDTYAALAARNRPLVATFMDLSRVHTAFRDAVVSPAPWRALAPALSEDDVPPPHALGARWNALFSRLVAAFAASQLCIKKAAVDAAVAAAARRVALGRADFHVRVYYDARCPRAEIAAKWAALRAPLAHGATRLRLLHIGFDGMSATMGLRTFLANVWPRLQILELQFGRHVRLDHVLAADRAAALRPVQQRDEDEPPSYYSAAEAFPRLEVLTMNTSVDDDDQRYGFMVAPHGEPLGDRTEFYDVSCSPAYGPDFFRAVEEIFCDEDRRFRTYVLGGLLKVFEWPGPSDPHEFNFSIESLQDVSDSLETGVVVSERRDEHICRRRMSLEQLAMVDDLTLLTIPNVIL